MSKREPLQEWWLGDEPAPKTTVVYDHDWGTWFVFPRGLGDEETSEHDTWTEAWQAAMELEGLR